MSTPHEKAQALRQAHAAPEPLVLVNAWDAASARVVAATPGCKAVATASWAIASVHGFPDGEQIGLDNMLKAVHAVAKAVELPVTADLERGYGDARTTVAAAVEAGAVGCNLEDGAKTGELIPAEQHAANVAAARESTDVPVVINARTDAFLEGVDDALDVAVERGKAYLAAGADCIFVPGVQDAETLRELVRRIRGPVSILARPGTPPLAELARIGIARVSYGPGPMGYAMAALQGLAKHLIAGGEPPAELAFRP
jgi:2-methylisocitrate lyase-like PEP mutase family enzyme